MSPSLRPGLRGIVLLAGCLLPLLGLLGACGGPQEQTSIRVVVSVPPDAWLVREVAGSGVGVATLARPGDSPESYQPTDAQVSAALRARIYFRTGVPFENGSWVEALRGQRRLRIVDLRQGVDVRGGEDPHIWLSPRLLRVQARTVARALDEVDPSGKEARAARLRRLLERLDETDGEIRKILAPFRERRVYVFHPAWGYFLDAYGLVQVAMEREGKGPSEADVTALLREARADGVKVVFVQKQVQSRAAEALASALGGEVRYLDPLAPDVTGNLVATAHAVADALR